MERSHHTQCLAGQRRRNRLTEKTPLTPPSTETHLRRRSHPPQRSSRPLPAQQGHQNQLQTWRMRKCLFLWKYAGEGGKASSRHDSDAPGHCAMRAKVAFDRCAYQRRGVAVNFRMNSLVEGDLDRSVFIE